MREQMCSVVSNNVGVKNVGDTAKFTVDTVVSSDALPYRRSSSIPKKKGMAHTDIVGEDYRIGGKAKVKLIVPLSRFPSIWEMFVKRNSVLSFIPIPRSDTKSTCASLLSQTRDCSPQTEKSGRGGFLLTFPYVCPPLPLSEVA